MSIEQLFPPTAPDLSDPLGLLRACHERIFQHCELIENLARHLAEGDVDQGAIQAAAKIHRYFSSAAKHHHADEEQDLFPRLSRLSPQLAVTIHQLEQEHRQLERLWLELEPLLAKLSTIKVPADFRTIAERFAEAYRNHARKENEELLDTARDLLSPDELQQIGQNMAERRGATLPANF